MSTMFASAPALPKVSNATIKKTNAFMVWKSQGNKCAPASRSPAPLLRRDARRRRRRCVGAAASGAAKGG